MDKNVEKQLAEFFAAHDTKKESVRQVKSEREQKEAAFLSQFVERRASILRPAFESFAKAVEMRGIKCRIEEQEEKALDQHQVQSAAITIAFVVGNDSHRRLSEYPHLTISCEKHASMLTLHKSTMSPGRGGQSGPAGKVGIQDVTENSLHQSLVELLQQSLL
ncbi:hypothetical protein [Sedimenticola hydrogenitrophicus]|uniref:hypothetical protein n=1 Tax=Sedimenticola hydrogenitrophicus TaxID=2967975 RepID=UPI0021A6EA9F|nr:hypothetical protein [Sedimenticola hydrogenitrophicus]